MIGFKQYMLPICLTVATVATTAFTIGINKEKTDWSHTLVNEERASFLIFSYIEPHSTQAFLNARI